MKRKYLMIIGSFVLLLAAVTGIVFANNHEPNASPYGMHAAFINEDEDDFDYWMHEGRFSDDFDYDDMSKYMASNGFRGCGQSDNFEAMHEWMDNLSEEDYDQMFDIMRSGDYEDMIEFMESNGFEDARDFHNENDGFGHGMMRNWNND